MAARIGVAERAPALGAEGAAIGAGEERGGGEADVGDAARQDEGPPGKCRRRERLGRRTLEVEAEAGRDCRARGGAPREAAGRRVGEVAGDEGAARREVLDPALGRELAVRGEDGVAVDAEGAREGAASGEDGAGAEAAAADVAGDGARDLEEDGLLRARVERQQELPGHGLAVPRGERAGATGSGGHGGSVPGFGPRPHRRQRNPEENAAGWAPTGFGSDVLSLEA